MQHKRILPLALAYYAPGAAQHMRQSDSDDEKEMVTCRSSSVPSTDEQRRSLLQDSVQDDVEGGSGDRPRATVSRLGLCACGAGLLFLLVLSFMPQSKPGSRPKSALPPSDAQTLGPILYKSFGRALGGGLGGAVAGVCQVLTLMWLRTTMNYQYRHGGSLADALRTLYAQGGVRRFYQGLPYALLQTCVWRVNPPTREPPHGRG